MTTIETCRTTIEAAKPVLPPSSGTPTSRLTIDHANPTAVSLGGNQLPRETEPTTVPNLTSSLGDPNSAVDHGACDAHHHAVDGGFNSQSAKVFAETEVLPPTGPGEGTDRTARPPTDAIGNSLFDPFLALAADVLDDSEQTWVANANRLRQLTRTEVDKDGEERGFGLDESHPDVARLATMVETLEQLTKDATKNLEKVVRRHPLHPWIKAQRGLGDKQVARLLAAIGDPYWNTLHDRPRTVSELWAYCGLHVLPAGQPPAGNQSSAASGGSSSGGDVGQGAVGAHARDAGVAPRRQRGRKSNWSEDARKRAWLISQSVVKSGGPYREIYDATKGKYADAVHTSPCVRCGPAGKPAQPGSPLSKAHIHARGLRAISKAVLKNLWIESKRLHELQADSHVDGDFQSPPAASLA